MSEAEGALSVAAENTLNEDFTMKVPEGTTGGYDLPEAAQSAVFRLAEEIKQRAARRLAYRLQRVSASGCYGDSYHHRSLWDEFRHEQNCGPYFGGDVWGDVLEGLLRAEVERLTPGEFEVVWLASLPNVEDLKTATRSRADVCEEFRSALAELASGRGLERFGGWS
ncbi:hypothetical protein [Shinella zoogloeoides]|uniref:hypothetical protein n=1 Tax=Shinella zoogloeoides TaxID=352475 RepID=UPI001F57EB29|nr:hypothetical protein [Shinella zoogloeoides]